MARIRSVKPEVFKHDGLFDLERETGLPLRLAWIGLWTVCDREGRFRWRPRSLKTDVLPHDDVDFGAVLMAFEKAGMVVRYTVGSNEYGFIPTWKQHQIINNRESDSKIPAPPADAGKDACLTRQARVPHAGRDAPSDAGHDAASGEGKGKEGSMEGKGREGNEAPAAPFEELPLTPFPETPDPTLVSPQRRLAMKWVDQSTRLTRHGTKADTVTQVEPQFAEWLRLKCEDKALEALLDEPERHRGEHLWEFTERVKERLLGAGKSRARAPNNTVSSFVEGVRKAGEQLKR